MNRLIGEKIDEIAALDAATDAAASADDVDFTPPVKPGAAVDDVGDHRGAIAYLSSEISRDVTPAIPYPTGAAADPDVRRAELGAELDALMALKMAVDTNEDPIVFLREMVDQAKELYGPTDPRTVAVDELLYHQERVQTMIARTQQNADLWIMARVGVEAGFDPRTLLRNIENGADSDTASRIRIILSQINPYFTELDDLVRNAVTAPDVVEDVVDLRRVGAVDDVPPPGALDPSALGLDAPPAPVGDADDLGTAPGAMDLLASGSADDVRQGLDLPESDDMANGLRLDGDGVRTDLETGPLVQPGFDETGAGWLDEGGGPVGRPRGSWGRRPRRLRGDGAVGRPGRRRRGRCPGGGRRRAGAIGAGGLQLAADLLRGTLGSLHPGPHGLRLAAHDRVRRCHQRSAGRSLPGLVGDPRLIGRARRQAGRRSLRARAGGGERRRRGAGAEGAGASRDHRREDPRRGRGAVGPGR